MEEREFESSDRSNVLALTADSSSDPVCILRCWRGGGIAAVSETKAQPQLNHAAASRSYDPSSVKVGVSQRTNHPVRKIEIAIVESVKGFHN